MASKKTPEINGGSMADISFLMLIFFLMVSTMDQERGIQRRLPPMPEKDQKVEDITKNRRNVMQVKINSRDLVFAGGQYISDVHQLDQIVIDFLTNPAKSETLSTSTMTMIEGFGEYPVSDGVISLQNDRSTHYGIYLEVQNALVRAINSIRNNFSMQNWGKTYENLDEAQQEIVRKAIPQSISESEPKDVKKK